MRVEPWYYFVIRWVCYFYFKTYALRSFGGRGFFWKWVMGDEPERTEARTTHEEADAGAEVAGHSEV